MKVKKIILAMVSTLILCAVTLQASVFATTLLPDASTTNPLVLYNLSISDDGEEDYSIVDNANASNVIKMHRIAKMTTNSNWERIKDAYCAWADKGFENRTTYTEDSNHKDTYTAKYNMVDDDDRADIINNVLLSDPNTYVDDEGTVTKYDAILQLTNLFLLEEDESNFDNYLGTTLKDAINSDENGTLELTYEQLLEVKNNGIENVFMNEKQVRAVQQAALWYFTSYGNSSYNHYGTTAGWLYVKNSVTGTPSQVATIKTTDEGAHSYIDKESQVLYNYLIDTAIENAKDDVAIENNVYLYSNLSEKDSTQSIIMIEKNDKEFDLALRKFITEVKDKNGNTISTYNQAKNRVPDTSSEEDLTGKGLKTGEKTAKKEHTKDAVTVKKGNIVVYKIRIYNEGEVEGYAKQVTDYLPAGLTLVDYTEGDGSINDIYGWKKDATGKIITTDYLKNDLIPAANRDWSNLDDVDSEGKNIEVEDRCYRDLLIECEVNSTATSKNLKNIAEITSSQGKNGETDVDSTTGNVTTNPSTYKGTHETTGRGQEDDDDFEDLKLNFDLALRKSITRVEDANGTVIKSNTDLGRTPVVDESTLPLTTGNMPTTATYNHKKDPVSVQNGYYVYYTLSVYNEGDVNGNATQIKDQLPAGLVAQTDSIVSDAFEFEDYDTTNNILTLKRKSGVAVQKSYEEGKLNDNKETVTVKCKVDTNQSGKVFTNIAWISGYYEEGNGVVTEDLDSQSTTPTTKPSASQLVTDNIGYTGGKTWTEAELNNNNFFYGQQDDDDFEKIKVENFDLALRKFIEKIKHGDTETKYTDRVPTITGNTVGEETTAEKKHDKTPKQVAKGDIVTYTIRIYNEGEVDGYASKVVDYLPEGLTFQKLANSDEFTNVYTVEEKTDSNGKKYLEFTMNSTTPVVLNPVGGKDNFSKLNDKDTNNKPIYYTDIKIECIVNDSATKDNLKNVAEITETKDKDGNTNPTEPDSTPKNLKDNEKKNPERDTSEKGKGWEDDDDYENLKLEELDLALRKFITRVADNKEMTGASEYYSLDNNGNITGGRVPTVSPSDIAKLYNGEITTAEYKHQKNKVKVNVGDYVEYTLRVYNEGSMDGYAKEITDHLPAYLEFVECDENTAYGWVKDSTNARKITTNYLNDTKLSAVTATVLDSSDKHNKELKIICRVVDNTPADEVQTNIAEITLYGDKIGRDLTVDRDSQTVDNNEYNGLVDLPDDKDLPNYKGHGDNKADLTDRNYHYKGQQDDDDFEKVYVPKFDLALRKFITKVETEGGVDRYGEADYAARLPQISQESYEKLKNGETTTLEYSHSKEPMNTVKTDVVTYTLRIFNEGNADGYASVITDDIPEGLVFLPDNETNKEYRWVMYAELPEGVEVADPSKVVELNLNGESEVKKFVETTDASKAVIVRTDYLSKEQGETRMEAGSTVNPNLIKALDLENGLSDTNPDYRDIKVVFKVTEEYGSERILINYAQISDDQDDEGKPVKDIDSTPDIWKEGEDDQDIEKLKVPQFDLALRKWVTQAIVTENGKTTVTNTGHDAWDDPEEIVKVELHRKKLSTVTVKFRYSIRVYNQGEIAGYAKEVTDYIPAGLKFVAEDNPGWTDEGNNVISTRLLENTLLQPGESADVEVLLTWINGNDNLGLKTNTAEISEDKNDWGVPDKDSTPDNKKPGEDDIDDAPVMLSVSTGAGVTYISLGLVVLITIAGGVALIKKYVM